MIQLGILDFLLDLALDWDDVESYEYLVPDPPEYIDRSIVVDDVAPVVIVTPSPSESSPDDSVSWKDIRTPIFRGGGLTIGELEEHTDQIVDEYVDFGKKLYWGWDYGNKALDDPQDTAETILDILNPFS